MAGSGAGEGGVTVLIYIDAIVAANLSVATFGPSVTVVNAFLLIGLDLTLRDRLHDSWRGRGLVPRMAVLIAAGGAISWALNAGAGQIALASTIAFVGAAIADGIAYALLEDYRRLVRVNGSNVVGAAVDSLLFPTIAFGGFLPLVTLGQFAAKVLGGFLWSLVGELSVPMLRRIRAAGYRPALVAQDGLEALPVPWEAFDVLFIGGSTAWKLSEACFSLIAEAKRRGKWVHMGRVNSLRRLRIAKSVGCDSVDGTYLRFRHALGTGEAEIRSWLRDLSGRPFLWDAES
jgi:hypothetical protein